MNPMEVRYISASCLIAITYIEINRINTNVKKNGLKQMVIKM